MKYHKYKKAYFYLFCEMCDIIEFIEENAPETETDSEKAYLLTVLTNRMKTVQQNAEEIIISD